jgi:hypothetical protein
VEQQLDELADLLRTVPTDRIREALVKDETIAIRVTAAEKEEMKRMASTCNTTLTEYLCGLHRMARDRMEG